MLTLENNSDELMKFLDTEKKAPRWFVDAMNAKVLTVAEYVQWLKKFTKIYGLLDNNAALFVERTGEIHFSIVADSDKSELLNELFEVKAELEKDFDHIFGWVNSRNRLLKKVCRQMGMEYYGFRKLLSHSHGKPIEWQCFHLIPKREFIAPNAKNVLSLA